MTERECYEEFVKSKHAYYLCLQKRLILEYEEFKKDKLKNLFWYGWMDCCLADNIHEMKTKHIKTKDIKILQLYFHPDKNPDQITEATKAFQFLQTLITQNDVDKLCELTHSIDRWKTIWSMIQQNTNNLLSEIQNMEQSEWFWKEQWSQMYKEEETLKLIGLNHLMELQNSCLRIFPIHNQEFFQDVFPKLTASPKMENKSMDEIYKEVKLLKLIYKEIRIHLYYREYIYYVNIVPGSSIYDLLMDVVL